VNSRSEVKTAKTVKVTVKTIKVARPNLRSRIRETTIQAILAAAEEVFGDAGLHAAHMGTIAAKAGVSVGTLYNHFEDREALLAGLLADRRTELIGRIDAAIAEGAARPLRERLRLILLAFFSHCEAHRQFIHIVLQREVGRYQQTYPQAWAGKTDAMREIYDRIEKEMKKGVRQHALRPELGDLGAVFFIGMLRALVIRDIVFQRGKGMAAELERLLDAFFHGLGLPGATP
jgi:AcrR family transcriptional regulator